MVQRGPAFAAATGTPDRLLGSPGAVRHVDQRSRGCSVGRLTDPETGEERMMNKELKPPVKLGSRKPDRPLERCRRSNGTRGVEALAKQIENVKAKTVLRDRQTSG